MSLLPVYAYIENKHYRYTTYASFFSSFFIVSYFYKNVQKKQIASRENPHQNLCDFFNCQNTAFYCFTTRKFS